MTAADVDRPAPLTPLECDCRDLDGFMLNVERLMASELAALATPEEFRAAVFLWCRSWKQVPAASLPSDDRVLASFSGAGGRWGRLREMALRGFVLCSDGRYYHPVLAQEAIRAYQGKQAFRRRREADAKRLQRWRASRDETANETPDETGSETRFVAEGKGQGRDREGILKKEPSLRSGSPRSPSQARQPAAPLAPDWTPDPADRKYAADLGLATGDVDREAIKFRGWWTSGKGAGKPKTPKGWRQAWQNWTAKAIDRGSLLGHQANGHDPAAPAPRPGSPEWFALHPETKPEW